MLVAYLSCFLLYTDPGSGALILQLVVGFLIGGAFYLRRIKDWIVLRKKRDDKEETSLSDNTTSK